MADNRLRPSLLGALLWIGLGVLFLLHNFGYAPDAWSMAARYWPVLLILLGAGKILDYFFRKDGIAIRAGELAGIFFLVMLGMFITSIYRHTPLHQMFRDFQFHMYRNAPWQFRQWIGNPRTFTEEKTYPVQPGTPVYIDHSYGSVSVLPGREGEITVRMKKSIYAGEAEARTIADAIRLQAESETNVLFPAPLSAGAQRNGKPGSAWFVIRTNRESMNEPNYRHTTDLDVYVPRNTQVRIKSAFGGIKVADINGDLALSASQSNLSVENCTGEFSAYSRFGESRLANLTGNVRLDARGNILADTIRGDMVINNEFSPVTLSNIEGKVAITGTSGNLRLENIAKPVEIHARGAQIHVSRLKDSLKAAVDHGNLILSDAAANVRLESRYMTITMRNIRGDVVMDSNSDTIRTEDLRGNFTLKARASGVWLNNIEGKADIQTSLKDVFIGGLEGECVVTNEYAGINITAQKLRKLIQAKNRSGAINLLLPESAPFSIIASARNGEISANYQGLPAAVREGNALVLRSSMKGGDPKILLDAEYGNISIAPSYGVRYK